MTAQRRIEARIGQLLGPPMPGNPHHNEGSTSQESEPGELGYEPFP
jgi:hypothetical protein